MADDEVYPGESLRTLDREGGMPNAAIQYILRHRVPQDCCRPAKAQKVEHETGAAEQASWCAGRMRRLWVGRRGFCCMCMLCCMVRPVSLNGDVSDLVLELAPSREGALSCV